MKRQDPDFLALKQAAKALEQACPQMRRAALIYLWDRFVVDEQTAPRQTKKCRH